MTDLEWRKTPEGYKSDGYQIRRLEDRPQLRWRLEATDGVGPWRGSRPLTTSVHRTLREAKERVRRNEQERIIRARAIGHFAVGMASLLAFVSIVTLLRSLVWFAIALLLVYLALRSFADAVGVWLGDAWGWTRYRGEPERMTLLGRGVLSMVERLRRRSLISAGSELKTAILMLPPEPPE